jgi:hypothetical protein
VVSVIIPSLHDHQYFVPGSIPAKCELRDVMHTPNIPFCLPIHIKMLDFRIDKILDVGHADFIGFFLTIL